MKRAPLARPCPRKLPETFPHAAGCLSRGRPPNKGTGRASVSLFAMKTLLPLLVVAASLASGCIHTHETIVHDDSRTPVSFENDTAARTFYEALSRLPNGGQHQESKTEVSIPIVFEHERKVVRGPNQAFNKAVSRCDTDRDGKITEQEARIYSQTVK